jgi:CheY-like chemotaxis protein
VSATSPENITTVLAVDDEPPVLAVIQLSLERAGYRVLSAKSASEAIAIGTEHAPCIRLMVLDVVMPDVSGPQLRERLHHVAKIDVPAVYVSGYPGVFRDADVPLLDKPFTSGQLLDAVERALAQPNYKPQEPPALFKMSAF